MHLVLWHWRDLQLFALGFQTYLFMKLLPYLIWEEIMYYNTSFYIYIYVYLYSLKATTVPFECNFNANVAPPRCNWVWHPCIRRSKPRRLVWKRTKKNVEMSCSCYPKNLPQALIVLVLTGVSRGDGPLAACLPLRGKQKQYCAGGGAAAESYFR